MQHTIKAGTVTKAVTAYDKYIDITVDGVDMRVLLHWDDNYGYEITWLDSEDRFITQPDWLDEAHDFCLKLDDTEAHSEVKL